MARGKLPPEKFNSKRTGRLPPEWCTWWGGVSLTYSRDYLTTLFEDCIVSLSTISVLQLTSDSENISSSENSNVRMLLDNISKRASVVELAIYLDRNYTTDFSFIGSAGLASSWINRRHLQLSTMPKGRNAFQHVCVIDIDKQPVMENNEGTKCDQASSLLDYRGVVDLYLKTDVSLAIMAILNGQSCNENQDELPLPAALHSCDESEHDSNNSSLMEENLPQSSAITEGLCDTMKAVSSQNPILSDQEPGKSKIVSDRTIKLKTEIESTKTSAEENKVIQLPESNMVDPQPAGDSILQTIDEEDESVESNESVLIDDEMLNGTDKCWPKVRTEECKAKIQISTDFIGWMHSYRVWGCDIDIIFCYLPNDIDAAEREKEKLSHELLKRLIGANCGKVQVPPMNPVWITGQNMTLEEITWEHFLYCYDRGNRLHNFESVNFCINRIALCDRNITLKFIKNVTGIDYVYDVEINVKSPLKNATATGSQSVSFKVHQCESSQGSTEEISRGSTELHSVTDSGEDFDIPVSEIHGSYISGRGDKDTSVALFISGIFGLICKQGSSTLLLVTAILLLCGSATATDVSQENKTHVSVKENMIICSVICLDSSEMPHLDSSDMSRCIDICNGLKKTSKNIMTMSSKQRVWITYKLLEPEIVSGVATVDDIDFFNTTDNSLKHEYIMERGPQVASLISGLENKLRKLTTYFETPHDYLEVIKNGDLLLCLEIFQMVFLICIIIILVKMLVSDKNSQNKLDNEWHCQPKTLFLAVSTSTLLVAFVEIQLGSERKKFEMSTSMSLQMVFCPAMCTLFNCLIICAKPSVYKSVKGTSIIHGTLSMNPPIACYSDESIIVTVMISTEWQDLLPPEKIFEDSFHAKCKAITEIDDLSQTCSATPQWYRNVDPVKSEYTTNAGSTRHLTWSHGVFSLSQLRLVLLCLVYGLLITHYNLHCVIIDCKDAGNEITVADSQWNSADNVDEVNGIIEADSEENSGDNVENKINEADSDENFGSNVDVVSKLIEADSGNSGDNVDESQKKVDGKWGSWSGWQACSLTFGGGYQKKYCRSSNPPSTNRGRFCHGPEAECKTCQQRKCPEELLSNDERETIVTSTDNYLAEYNEQTDSLSLAGTRRIDNSLITFLYEFKSKFIKHLYRKICLEYRAEVTEMVEKDNIDYDEEAFDAVGISLKKNNTGEMYPSRYTFNNKKDGKTHWVLTEDYEDLKYINDQEMHHAVFSAAVTPTNEVRFNRSKIVEIEVIEQSCSNVENCEGSKYKLAIEDDKQIRAVGDEVSSCSTELATLVTDYFNDNQQQQNNATVAAEGCSNLIETNVKEAESLNERLCNRKKTNPSDKQKDVVDTVGHNGNMAEIRAMSLVSDLTDLPFPHIDTSYLRALVYRIEEPLLAVIDRLASDNPPTPHISMRYELLRFCTLRTYPRGDKPYLIRLAAAGFYYASDGDGVVCYCCGSRRYNWTGLEDPMKVHQGIKPNCKFLIKNEDVNVPVVYKGPWSKSLVAIEAIPEPKVITQEVENVNREYAPERQRNQESVNEQQTLGINNATPKHSQYTIKSQRLNSYKDWPKTSKLKPDELADAGFFHAGFGDCVRCFFCGIGLRHWSDDDDPWIEHARWARTCVFVRQKKGEEFVNLVQLAVQLTQDNGQAGATVEGSGKKNSVPVSTIEKLLLSKAALSAAELGFHTEIIKRAVEEMIGNGVTDNISPDDLLCKVLEIEGRDERAAASTAGSATSQDTNRGNGSENKTSISSSAEPSKKNTANGDEKTKTDNTKKQSNKTEKTKPDKGNDSDSLQDPVAIKHENEVLKEQTLCKVCLDNTVCIVFLPCGHLVTCADCAPAMRKCPICRALVRGTVRTYMS